MAMQNHDLRQRQQRVEAMLFEAGVMPVLTVDSVEQALQVVRALSAGGLDTVELTLRTPAALDALAAIKETFPQCRVGAGTVLEPAQIDAVEELGADYIVTPGVSPHLLDALVQSSLPVVPGAATPGELLALRERGIHVAKLFPAATLGGIAMLKALHGPLPKMKFCANGGIEEATAADYLAQPNVLCVGGSWMVPKEWLAGGEWDKVTESAARAAGIVRMARESGGRS
jgi:2-dehydro-3-deoxyphosphogluconate aldolase/(4S)-4-hydroxy-2-oxoglutarate aldolase